MSTVVGLVLVSTGLAIIAVALAMAVAEIIAGQHRRGGSIGTTMAGWSWSTFAAIVKGFAAIVEALKDWPPPALLILLGIVEQVIGVWMLATKPF
jgi:hypothetical protein